MLAGTLSMRIHPFHPRSTRIDRSRMASGDVCRRRVKQVDERVVETEIVRSTRCPGPGP